MTNLTPSLSPKEAALIACLDALAPANSLDCHPDDLKAALSDAIRAMGAYPGIKGLRRKIIKDGTPDSYVAKIENDLRLCLEGKGTILTLCVINAALADALELVQRELKAD